MKSFSPWPLRTCLTGIAGLTLAGSALIVVPPTPAAPGTAQDAAQRATLTTQDDDRGSGRLRQRIPSHRLSYRGSGRVNPDAQRPIPQTRAIPMAYRGSGRVTPLIPGQA